MREKIVCKAFVSGENVCVDFAVEGKSYTLEVHRPTLDNLTNGIAKMWGFKFVNGRVKLKPKRRRLTVERDALVTGCREALTRIVSTTKHQERSGYNEWCAKCVAEAMLAKLPSSGGQPGLTSRRAPGT